MKTKVKDMLSCIISTCHKIEHDISLWMEWQDAKYWAKKYYPSWVQLATQRKRPEIRETYRNKILREYYESCW